MANVSCHKSRKQIASSTLQLNSLDFGKTLKESKLTITKRIAIKIIYQSQIWKPLTVSLISRGHQRTSYSSVIIRSGFWALFCWRHQKEQALNIAIFAETCSLLLKFLILWKCYYSPECWVNSRHVSDQHTHTHFQNSKNSGLSNKNLPGITAFSFFLNLRLV